LPRTGLAVPLTANVSRLRVFAWVLTNLNSVVADQCEMLPQHLRRNSFYLLQIVAVGTRARSRMTAMKSYVVRCGILLPDVGNKSIVAVVDEYCNWSRHATRKLFGDSGFSSSDRALSF
jgi:hypothetical protein